jgi:hypothetical protein
MEHYSEPLAHPILPLLIKIFVYAALAHITQGMHSRLRRIWWVERQSPMYGAHQDKQALVQSREPGSLGEDWNLETLRIAESGRQNESCVIQQTKSDVAYRQIGKFQPIIKEYLEELVEVMAIAHVVTAERVDGLSEFAP